MSILYTALGSLSTVYSTESVLYGICTTDILWFTAHIYKCLYNNLLALTANNLPHIVQWASAAQSTGSTLGVQVEVNLYVQVQVPVEIHSEYKCNYKCLYKYKSKGGVLVLGALKILALPRLAWPPPLPQSWHSAYQKSPIVVHIQVPQSHMACIEGGLTWLGNRLHSREFFEREAAWLMVRGVLDSLIGGRLGWVVAW